MKRMLTTVALIIALFTGAFSQISLEGKAPAFKAKSTNGEINYPDDYFGKWTILFSHPAAFTPICSSEIIELALKKDEFKKLNTELLVISADGHASHIEWVKSLESISYKNNDKVKIDFPLIGDPDLAVSKKYGLENKFSKANRTIRKVIIVDPNNKIKAIFTYPDNVGRNVDEILRTLIALQKTDKEDVLLPADWVEGNDVLLPPPSSVKESEKLTEKAKKDKSLYSYDWYFWFKKEK